MESTRVVKYKALLQWKAERGINVPLLSSWDAFNRNDGRMEEEGEKMTYQHKRYGRDGLYKDVFTMHFKPYPSPLYGKVLKPFIRRDFQVEPVMKQILEHFSSQVHPVDYYYLQKIHLLQVNVLLGQMFWPNIDVKESLDFPDFTIIACYKRLVVGCGLMTPEGYITYLIVRPGWQRVGIAEFMLHHLIQTAVGRDVTLHVAATNPAMILYQRFGFKPEEFIVKFYEKYLPENSRECKNAYFMRRRR